MCVSTESYFMYFLFQLKKDGVTIQVKRMDWTPSFASVPSWNLLQYKGFVKDNKIIKDEDERKCNKNGKRALNQMLATEK